METPEEIRRARRPARALRQATICEGQTAVPGVQSAGRLSRRQTERVSSRFRMRAENQKGRKKSTWFDCRLLSQGIPSRNLPLTIAQLQHAHLLGDSGHFDAELTWAACSMVATNW